jgi:hypothetical protein
MQKQLNAQLREVNTRKNTRSQVDGNNFSKLITSRRQTKSDSSFLFFHIFVLSMYLRKPTFCVWINVLNQNHMIY